MGVELRNGLDHPELSDHRLKRVPVVAFAMKSMLVMAISAYSNVNGSNRELSEELRS